MQSNNPSTNAWPDQASQKLGVSLRRHTATQYVGPCPHCHDGEDRFVVFIEGNFWCRQCNYKGWWTEERLDRAGILRVEQQKREKSSVLYHTMHSCTSWQDYYHSQRTYEIWYSEGRMNYQEVDRWGLGYCDHCPVAPDFPSLTIPVWYKGKLWDIRHRLIGADDREKYRSHLAGLQPFFFNLDVVSSAKKLYVVEGEKKAIRLTSLGLEHCIGYPGAQHLGKLPAILAKIGEHIQEIVFIPDPGTEHKVLEIAGKIKPRSYMVELWNKVDDFIDLYGSRPLLNAIRIPTPI